MPVKEHPEISIIECELTRMADCAMQVEGNGMWPLYKAGDLVLVQNTDKLEPGEFGVFDDGERHFIRQFYPEHLHLFRPDLSNCHINAHKSYMICGRILGTVTDIMRPPPGTAEYGGD